MRSMWGLFWAFAFWLSVVCGCWWWHGGGRRQAAPGAVGASVPSIRLGGALRASHTRGSDGISGPTSLIAQALRPRYECKYKPMLYYKVMRLNKVHNVASLCNTSSPPRNLLAQIYVSIHV